MEIGAAACMHALCRPYKGQCKRLGDGSALQAATSHCGVTVTWRNACSGWAGVSYLAWARAAMTSPPPLRRSRETGKEATVVPTIMLILGDDGVILRAAE